MIRVIGLMSGTSLDGVDVAVLETDGVRIGAFGPRATLYYDEGLRADLRAVLDAAPGLAADDAWLAGIERRLTDYHAEACALVGGGADLVGFHGQTILHDPARGRTWQIGDAKRLAHKVRLPVAYDFRSADVAGGGQGAPLVPLFHRALAEAVEKPLLVVNIGGVANVTWLGAEDGLLACDTGPGNGPLDDYMMARTGRAFDEGGEYARAGRVDEARLAALMDHAFFRLPAPKSLDRLAFSGPVAGALEGLSVQDGAALLAAFTARAIAAAPLPAPPARVVVAGGGRHNAAIMVLLGQYFACPVDPVEALGWDGDALEAQCFAYLAARVVYGLPLSVPETTGVRQAMVGGRVEPPIHAMLSSSR